MSRETDIARIAAVLTDVAVAQDPEADLGGGAIVAIALEPAPPLEMAATLYDAGLRLLADTPSVEPREGRLAEIAESVLADLASRPAITTWATPDVKVGDWFRVVVVTADEDKVIASLVSMDRPSVEPHQSGAFGTRCVTCGADWDVQNDRCTGLRPSVEPAGVDEPWRRKIAAADAWIGWDTVYCYWCGKTEDEGHADDCVWVAAAALPTQASDSPEKTT